MLCPSEELNLIGKVPFTTKGDEVTDSRIHTWTPGGWGVGVTLSQRVSGFLPACKWGVRCVEKGIVGLASPQLHSTSMGLFHK